VKKGPVKEGPLISSQSKNSIQGWGRGKHAKGKCWHALVRMSGKIRLEAAISKEGGEKGYFPGGGKNFQGCREKRKESEFYKKDDICK